MTKTNDMSKPPIDLTSVQSSHNVSVTVTKLKAQIKSKGLTLFAEVDHSAGARAVGLQMQEATVLVFGNALAGTPLMVANSFVALDLPLKVLIWCNEEGKVQVSFNTLSYFANRYDLPDDLLKGISGLSKLVDAALT